MPTIIDRITQRLRSIYEHIDTSWKEPYSGNYDRQWAEDALFHTIGPLTDTPHWISKWSSPSEPVPGFVPNGPAPTWTPEEVVMAFAGDPKLLFRAGGQDRPSSPSYGDRGGAPLYRLANKIARKYNRAKDKSFIEDLYGNGFVELSHLMHPGYDEQRAPFISWVFRNIEAAMEHGSSGTGLPAIKARGDVSKDTGLIGLQGLLKAKTPEEARKVANQVKGKYQHERSHDKNDTDNPFGPYSSTIFKLANDYADALAANDKDAQDQLRQQINNLSDKIENDQEMILGASTGVGQAISTQDRVTSIGVNSIDVPNASGKGTMGDNLGAAAGEDSLYADVDPEAIQFILKIALEHDLGASIGHLPKYQELAKSFGLKLGDKIGGKLTANELRWTLRQLGHMGANYPGKGTLRAAVNIPRDKPGWWKPGEDPEIEPIPAGGTWHSIWSRTGNPPEGGTEIAKEMTAEVLEFNKLGIATGRTAKAKAGGVTEAVSKVAIGNTVAGALIKLKLIAAIHRSQTGMDVDESLVRGLRTSGFPLLEDYDPTDRRLINSAWAWVFNRLNRAIAEAISEDAPPGWSGTVKAMKKHKDIDNPYALAWSMHGAGKKPHKKPEPGKPKYKKPD